MIDDDISEEEKQLIRAYQDVFIGSPEGQLVFWDLVNLCGVFKASGPPSAQSYVESGKRDIGLRLFRMVELTQKLGKTPGPKGIENMRKGLDRVEQLKKGVRKNG